MNDSRGEGCGLGVRSSGVDLEHSQRVLEECLTCDLLNESQRDNARRMARDLLEGREVWESVPFRVLWEFNRECNVKCVHCDLPRQGAGRLSIELLERLLDEIGWGLWEIMPLAGGEPTLAPVHEAAPLLRRRNVYLNFITNGILFDRAWFEPLLDCTSRVQFSLHSHRREVFERIAQGAGFERVVRNLRDVVEMARSTETHVVPCIVLMKDVVEELPDYVSFVAGMGVERLIVQKLYPGTRNLEELRPESAYGEEELAKVYARTLRRAREEGVYIETNVGPIFGDPENEVPPSRFNLHQENVGIVELFRPGFCMSAATQAVVECDGVIVPCVKDHLPLGNVEEVAFLEAWNGSRMRHLRRSFVERAPSANCEFCHGFHLGHP